MHIISCPLTVKIRLQDPQSDLALATAIEQAGADALIVHGRRWQDDYDIACNYQRIALIKQAVTIPVIANGDIETAAQLQTAVAQTGCDAFMISRAGTGKPWLYDGLLHNIAYDIAPKQLSELYLQHLQGLIELEGEYKAIFQSKSLFRYYFKACYSEAVLQEVYRADSLKDIMNAIQYS